MVILAVAEATFENISLMLLAALCSVLFGMLVYIWKSALSDIRERIDFQALRIKDLEKTSITKDEYEKTGLHTIAAIRESQAQLLNLSERITTFMIEIPQEFAKEENCKFKHKGLESLVAQVQISVEQSLQKLDVLNNCFQDIRLWQGRLEERHKIETGSHGKQQ
jgi:hypothetical protein